MDGPRLRILNLLQRNNRATVDQLSREMDLASATIRRHLDILQRDHLVTFQQVKKRTGRPQYSYHLTEAGQESLPKDYDRLLGGLIQELSNLSQAEVGSGNGEGVLQLLFERMAQRTVAGTEVDSQTPLSQRVSSVVDLLQQQKFEPEIEETNGTIRILLHNCPFRSVAMENGGVCNYDSLLISSMLGRDVVQEDCIRHNDAFCCYVASTAPESD